MSCPPSFAPEFLRRLQSQHSAAAHLANAELPNYRFHDASDQALLVTRSAPLSFQLGTGASIFTDCLIPAITSARSEVIIVTCFWAPSKTLTALRDALARLATHRRALIDDALSRGSRPIPPLSIRICLSSRSLLQKLLHPQSRSGYVYPPSSWSRQLGLPDAALLEAGAIQLQVKSLFFLPFSVMHPKFIIIDRQRAFVPSCNVSWEPWLEGCVEIRGDAVRALMSFYSRTWEEGTLDFRQPLESGVDEADVLDSRQAHLILVPSTAHHRTALPGPPATLPTLLLPSPCHRNPHFRPLPWQKHPEPPSTPLNIALLQLFGQARQSIYIQTPNMTCEPVVVALLDALGRGADVTIVTSRNMMLLEQLITAGTTTTWCIRSLVRRFRRLKAASDRDLEAGRRSLGQLRISYFRARSEARRGGREGLPLLTSDSSGEEPVHSHLKLTVVDHEYTVLGSGNMDRASWYTSQELGILFHDSGFAEAVMVGVNTVLEGRLDLVFESDESRD
ncbi:hypothetical protein MFIFM68171_04011 [Madurella fahalii]|uniref:PLD phosphodiesterase domain-containing protein n=1 Tax=Madurella fahalii TaxID=1157608 RepID=A0ABQ0G7T1_9PEZI